MNAERYFELCEQMGREPQEDQIPVEFSDLPEIAQEAVNCFNCLGDKIVPDIGYIGKDYTNLPYFIPDYDTELKQFFIEILCWLDDKAIKKSSDKMKQEHEKLKRKHRG
jgi:hypothetical protein